MTTFLIIFFSLYVCLSVFVAITANDNGRSPVKWLFAALAVNPMVAFALLYSRVSAEIEDRAREEADPQAATVAA